MDLESRLVAGAGPPLSDSGSGSLRVTRILNRPLTSSESASPESGQSDSESESSFKPAIVTARVMVARRPGSSARVTVAPTAQRV